MMSQIIYSETDQRDLDVIGPLWQKLLEHHKERSWHFTEHFSRMTFDTRKKELLEKSASGVMRIDLASDAESGEIIGYCISTITGDKQGEIDSIYVERDYRRAGIGDTLMKRTLDWMDKHSVRSKTLIIGVGNEEVVDFYRSYHFEIRSIIMEQVEAKGG